MGLGAEMNLESKEGEKQEVRVALRVTGEAAHTLSLSSISGQLK